MRVEAAAAIAAYGAMRTRCADFAAQAAPVIGYREASRSLLRRKEAI